MKHVFGFTLSVIMIVLIAYGLLSFLEVDTGTFVDWLVGTGSFIWLMTIVTVPWNAHFKAREVLDDAKTSKRKDIKVIEDSLVYAKKVARTSLLIALSLHIISAFGLFAVAFFGLSEVGYFAAGAAVLLAFLRPAVRFYEYLNRHLNNIQREFRYPREDVDELLKRINEIESLLNAHEDLLSIDAEKNSWKQDTDKTVKELIAKLQKYRTENDEQLNKMHDEQQNALAKIEHDAKVLESIRELVRFFKKS